MRPIITTDFTSFKAGVMMLQALIPVCSLRGIRLATEELKKDSLIQIPMCPVATGELASKHKVLPAEQRGTHFECTLYVPGPYAASLHEGFSRYVTPSKFKTPGTESKLKGLSRFRKGTPYKFKTLGTGAKWIESKLIRNSEKYLRIVADELPK